MKRPLPIWAEETTLSIVGVKFHRSIEHKLAYHIQFPFFIYGIPDKVLGQNSIMVLEGNDIQVI